MGFIRQLTSYVLSRPFDFGFTTILFAVCIRKFGLTRQNILSTTVIALAFLLRGFLLPSDPDGWDPSADTVGPGIYGGRVKVNKNDHKKTDPRDLILWSDKQYQNHNPWTGGPVYAGGGYSPMSQLIRTGNVTGLRTELERDPTLSMEISTGAATPLHTCGMVTEKMLERERMKEMVNVLLEACKKATLEAPSPETLRNPTTWRLFGKEFEGKLSQPTKPQAEDHLWLSICVDQNFDTWGYTPLHRAAGNDVIGAIKALLAAGADSEVKSLGVFNFPSAGGETALETAKADGAGRAVELLSRWKKEKEQRGTNDHT
ncbi:unnamed protein product [Amoebophrya sp. A25]|nr:unnamed protein product [Amoebophrya sp. A25]|eukprot:GSA25T00010153001.1